MVALKSAEWLRPQDLDQALCRDIPGFNNVTSKNQKIRHIDSGCSIVHHKISNQ